MTKQIEEPVAQEQFDELLDAVERGETFIIMRQGKPIARLVSEEEARRASPVAD